MKIIHYKIHEEVTASKLETTVARQTLELREIP